jgi:hypothetical protein
MRLKPMLDFKVWLIKIFFRPSSASASALKEYHIDTNVDHCIGGSVGLYHVMVMAYHQIQPPTGFEGECLPDTPGPDLTF